MGFEEIYEKHFKSVYLYLLRISGSRDVAEEVTSEAFFKAMKSIDTFRGDCSISTWLCRIAKNCYLTYAEKNGRTQTLDEDSAYMGSEQDPQTIAADRDDVALIKRRLHELPETYKEVFMWRVFAQMSFSDIGALFGKTANWACVTYHRARKMIAEKMEGDK